MTPFKTCQPRTPARTTIHRRRHTHRLTVVLYMTMKPIAWIAAAPTAQTGSAQTVFGYRSSVVWYGISDLHVMLLYPTSVSASSLRVTSCLCVRNRPFCMCPNTLQRTCNGALMYPCYVPTLHEFTQHEETLQRALPD